MPELPEVEACRRLASKYCLDKSIIEAQVADDDKVIEGIAPAALQEALQGRTIKQAHRKGKHMWLEFDQGPCLMLHFGMTGVLAVKGVKSHQYKNFKVDGTDWPPKFWKVALKLSDDVSIAFLDTRRFARVRLQQDPADHEPVSLLGFDPVLSMPSLKEFTNLVKARKTSLKALLLDQGFSAGVGNWVADEVLYQAQLYPEVKASALSEDEIQRLHKALKDVPETAVAAEADSERFPPDWLFHVRWGGPKKSPKVNGQPVEYLKVGGRTTAYVPAVQKAPPQDASSPKKGKRKAKTEAAAASSSDNESDQQQSEHDETAAPVAKPSKRSRQTAAKSQPKSESEPKPGAKSKPKPQKAAPAKTAAKASKAAAAGKKRSQAALKEDRKAADDDSDDDEEEEGEQEDGEEEQEQPTKVARAAGKGHKAVQQQEEEQEQPKAAAKAGVKAGKAGAKPGTKAGKAGAASRKGSRGAKEADPFEMSITSEEDQKEEEAKQRRPKKAARASGKAATKAAQSGK